MTLIVEEITQMRLFMGYSIVWFNQLNQYIILNIVFQYNFTYVNKLF